MDSAQEWIWQQERFRAMNTDIELMYCVPHAMTLQGEGPSAFAKGWFASAEARFSRFLAYSELAVLNRSGGRPTLVSDTMLEVLQLAVRMTEWTNGIYEPAVHQALVQAGYDRSFDELARIDAERAANTGEADDRTLSPIAGRDGQRPAFRLDAAMGAVTLQDGTTLDLGGIVKSWTADRLASLLIKQWRSPRGLVNAGGDVRVWGGAGEHQPWEIAVADPWQPERDLALMRCADGAVATSSVLGRRWRTKNGAAHHLIDPRTMRPSDSDVVQCSIAGRELPACETAAKTILILGSADGLDWLRKAMPDAKVLLVLSDQTVSIHGGEWEVFPT
jgi:thiamine biosynthesis lipoprotein